MQRAAFAAVSEYLAAYEVETRGVYIQDVVFPEELVEVLTRREIANQERATYEEQQRAETARVEMEKARGTADMQAELAAAQVSVDISTNQAQAREAEAGGEAAYVRLTGQAEADRTQAIGLAEAKATEALGLARAAGFEAQRDAIGETATALVAVAGAVAEGKIDIMPEVLVTGGGGGALDGLAVDADEHAAKRQRRPWRSRRSCPCAARRRAGGELTSPQPNWRRSRSMASGIAAGSGPAQGWSSGATSAPNRSTWSTSSARSRDRNRICSWLAPASTQGRNPAAMASGSPTNVRPTSHVGRPT